MQVIRGRWTPPTGTLGELVAAAGARVAQELTGRRAELEREAAARPPAPPLGPALAGEHVAVIAELKRSSPSKGAINAAMDAPSQARAYAAGGAAALSVLTEPSRFGGSAADLAAVAAAVDVPLVRKDFHVDALQLVEARALGASGALLIARALDEAALMELAGVARELGLEPLVEVRDEWELERAVVAGARVIGVNNRDLETLVIDRATGERVVPLVPPGCVAVFESGVHDVTDVEFAARAGADAVLVGSSVSAAADPAAAVRALTGVPRTARRAVGR